MSEEAVDPLGKALVAALEEYPRKLWRSAKYAADVDKLLSKANVPEDAKEFLRGFGEDTYIMGWLDCISRMAGQVPADSSQYHEVVTYAAQITMKLVDIKRMALSVPPPYPEQSITARILKELEDS